MNTSAGLAGTIRRQMMKGKGKPKKMPVMPKGGGMKAELPPMMRKKKGKK
jgi:hypothetical protein